LPWAVQVLHWGEGKFWMGTASGLSQGDWVLWNDAAYPTVMVDPLDSATLTPNALPALLSDGYQAPLWDLVLHDCIVTTTHWSRPPVLSITRTTASTVDLSFLAAPGQSYTLRISPDLSAWSVLATLSNTNATLGYLDSLGPNPSQKLYRLSMP
jgi:hypothetical protein